MLRSMNKTTLFKQLIQRPEPYYGAPPTPSVDEWRQLGVAVAIFPAVVLSVAGQAAWSFLNRLKEEGPAAMDSYRAEVQAGRWGRPLPDLLGHEALIRDVEERFIPAVLQRDYEHTKGHGG